MNRHTHSITFSYPLILLLCAFVGVCGCNGELDPGTAHNQPRSNGGTEPEAHSPVENGSDENGEPDEIAEETSSDNSEVVNQMAAEAIAIEAQRLREQRERERQNSTSTDGTSETERAEEERPIVQRELAPDDSGVYDITFDDIAFEMETGEEFQRSMLTQNVRTLHKEKIRIRGYIHPSAQRTGNTDFIFVRDDKECCFGPQAALYDCILVSLAKDVTTDFSARPISVEGLFFVREYKIGDQILAIYNMRHGRVN